MRRADGRRTWTWAWTFAWVFAGAFLFAGNAGAQAPACLSGTELATLYSAEELVLEARLERGRLSLDGGLLAYRHAGRVYLPLVDVHLHLELPTPSPAAITAIGCTVPVEDAYAEAGALGGLLAAVLDLDASAMRLAIRSSQWFPIEQRRQRERSWQALARRRPLGNPDAPFQPSPHALIEKHSGTLSLFTVGQPSRGTSGEYTLQGAGDLLGMSSRYVVSGDREQAVRNGSGLLERYDASARLLGALGARSVQIGDVSGISDVLLTSGVSGRGVAVGNQARGSRGGFGQTVIAGLLPDGWSVELLRGGELVAVQTEAINGRYEFLDVELEYGGNEFILNFFGPAGERRTEVISESVGSGLARAGEWQYQAVARQSGTGLNGRSRGNVSGLRDDGDWLQTRGRYGWRRWLTQDFGADLFRAQDGGPTSTFASTGFTARLGRWQAQGRGLSELRQGRTAFDAALSGQVSGGSLFARHIDFAGIDMGSIQTRLTQIAVNEGVEIEPEATQILASRAADDTVASRRLIVEAAKPCSPSANRTTLPP